MEANERLVSFHPDRPAAPAPTGRTCRRCGEEELAGVRYTEACLMAPNGVSGHSWRKA